MPDQRTHQSVADRLELRLERFPNPLHRRRRWFTLAGGLIPLLLVGVFAARGDHSIFLSQPVTASHQYFQAECQKCHLTPWQPLIRLASDDPTASSVRDQACHDCHDQRQDDRDDLATATRVPDCADCHQEHRGAIRLTDQADASCVECHEPFANHPQFALLEKWTPPREVTVSAAKKLEQLRVRAELQPDGATWSDKTSLKFSHQNHLAPLQVPWKQDAGATAPAKTKTLTCADCHALDANREYMQPIVYENHCMDCHPLGFISTLQSPAKPESKGHYQGLPHESPEIVHGVMRERLIDFARRNPQEVLRQGIDAKSRLPNSQAHRAPTPKQEWQWVEEELRELEKAIFRTPVSNGPLPINGAVLAGDAASPGDAVPPSNACLKCHESGGVSSGDAAPGFSIAPPGIPKRWFPNSRFSHDRHLKMDCVACHQAKTENIADAEASPRTTTLNSSTVQDILMPSIRKCQECHGASAHSSRAVLARENCTECHQYHHGHVTKEAHGTPSH